MFTRIDLSVSNFLIMITLCFLTYTLAVASYQLEPDQYLIPEVVNGNVESFQYEDRRFVFYDWQVTFDEASIICEEKGLGGSLAMLIDEDAAQFVAIALSETTIEQGNYWIGARKLPGQDTFAWLNGFPLVSALETPVLFRNMTSELDHNNRTCLTIERNFHETPQFIDLDCSLLRPFVCEEDLSSNDPVLQATVEIGAKKYVIYNAQVTWNQAIAFCREYDMRLATFDDIAETNLVGRWLLKSRPSIEMAWVGGYYDQDCWKFLSTQKEIPSKTSQETAFPPWLHNFTDKTSGCLLLDRHLEAHPVFHPARCERKRPFVCERESQQHGPATAVAENGQGFALFYENKTWLSAQYYCKSHGMKLAEPKTRNDLYRIILLMAENVTIVNHVWLGADWGPIKVDGTINDWRWATNFSPVSEYMKSLPFLYNPTELTFGRVCLNMDRENHNELLLYGLACNKTQFFVCENLDGTSLPKELASLTPRPKRYYTSTLPTELSGDQTNSHQVRRQTDMLNGINEMVNKSNTNKFNGSTFTWFKDEGGAEEAFCFD